jgi:hypothetical protein
MKFEIEPLIAEMLDHLPDSVWISDSTTFFDPAIGGGQFVRAIEQRLRSQGHSDQNIRKRVFGLETSDLHIRYAVNKHKLVGQYAKKPYEKFLELDDTVKFDVVVGNPPYQKENSKAKRWTLWEEFVKKSKTLADTVIMVTPQSVTSPSTFKLIKDNATVINIDVSKHFNVGSTFCYWMIDNRVRSTSTRIITNTNEYQLDLSKVDFLPTTINDETLALVNVLTSRKARIWQRGELHTSNTNLFSATGKYNVIHTNAQTLRSDTNHPNRTKIRVVVSLSGYPTFQVLTNGYVSQACFWTECATIQDAQALANECNGTEIQKILEVFKWSGWNSKEVIKCL